jgi:hypothetical protein
MRSKCLNYKISSTTCAPVGLGASKQHWGPIAYVKGKGYNVTTSDAITYTFIGLPFATTDADAFGVQRPLQGYRTYTPSSGTITKDFYGIV